MTIQSSLASKLKDFQNAVLIKVSPEATIYDVEKTADLASSGVIDNSLKVSENAPEK